MHDSCSSAGRLTHENPVAVNCPFDPGRVWAFSIIKLLIVNDIRNDAS